MMYQNFGQNFKIKRETEKAMLIEICKPNEEKEFWIPKSAISFKGEGTSFEELEVAFWYWNKFISGWWDGFSPRFC